MATIDLGL